MKMYTVQYFDTDTGWETVDDIHPACSRTEAEAEANWFKKSMPYRIKTRIVCE